MPAGYNHTATITATAPAGQARNPNPNSDPNPNQGEYIKQIMDQGDGKAAGTGRLKIPRDAPQLMVIPTPTPTPTPPPPPISARPTWTPKARQQPGVPAQLLVGRGLEPRLPTWRVLLGLGVRVGGSFHPSFNPSLSTLVSTTGTPHPCPYP